MVEGLRKTFDEDAERYDRARPGYPPALFDDLAGLAAIGPGSRVLEIGCGTGQATTPMIRRGWSVKAVELSPELSALARNKLPELEVITAEFEDWPLPAERFDLVLSATAFHWIDPEVRVVKSADALRQGGVLAVVSTHHVAGGSESFFEDVQDCYLRFMPGTPKGLRLAPADAVQDDPGEFDASGRFGRVEFRRYEWELQYTTAQYLDLLSSYSNHRSLTAEDRHGLYGCVAALIEGDGGRITKRYLTQLTAAAVLQ
jgi:SAM-dependent methyltransferase